MSSDTVDVSIELLGYTKEIAKKEPKLDIRLCKAVLTKGKRKNEPCNRKITSKSNTDEFCKFHTDKVIEGELCPVILTKGERKNQPCNRICVKDKKLCKSHAAFEDKKPYNPYLEKETNLSDKTKDQLLSILCELKLESFQERTVDMLNMIQELQTE